MSFQLRLAVTDEDCNELDQRWVADFDTKKAASLMMEQVGEMGERMSGGGPETNVQRVTRYMEINACGPLAQAFVIEAINKYAEQVLVNKAKLRKQMENHMVHPDAWIGCAEEWLKTAPGR